MRRTSEYHSPAGARFNKDKTRRLRLWRTWQAVLPRCCFICLNPSTADDKKNDHSVTKMIGFASRFGCGAIDVVNLFDLKSTYPSDLYGKPLKTITTPANDGEIVSAALNAKLVICAWGGHGKLLERDQQVLELLRLHDLMKKVKALAINGDGTPAHPLRLPYMNAPVTYGG